MQRALQRGRATGRRAGLTSALTAVALLATAGTPALADSGTRSQHLTRAIDAIDERDPAKARLHLKLALQAGQHSRDDTVTIYRLSGEVAASYGFRAEAERFFRLMLALDPRADVAVAQVPKVAEPYDAARAYFESEHQPLAIEHDFDRETGVVTVRVVSDPLELVKGVRLIYGTGDRRGSREASYDGGDVPLDVPAAQRGSSWITVVDEYGNQLTPLVAASPETIAAPPEPSAERARSLTRDPFADASEDSDSRSLVGRWYVWGVLTVGAAGTAAFYGSRANEDWRDLDAVIENSDKYDYQEAAELESAGKRKALIANIATGAAVTTGLVTAVLLIRDVVSGSPRTESRRGLGAAPTVGGATVTWEMGF